MGKKRKRQGDCRDSRLARARQARIRVPGLVAGP